MPVSVYMMDKYELMLSMAQALMTGKRRDLNFGERAGELAIQKR